MKNLLNTTALKMHLKTILLKTFFLNQRLTSIPQHFALTNPLGGGGNYKPNTLKSQSAMEYLMTYGWAILIIAIVMAALFSLGIFNPYTFSPKASPGSCQVIRTGAAVSLIGTCTGQIPESVASFPYYSVGSINLGYTPLYVNNLNQYLTALTITYWVKPRKPYVLVGFQTSTYAPPCFITGCTVPNGITVYTPSTPKNNVWSFISLTLLSSGSAIMYLNGNPGTAVSWNGITHISSFYMLGYFPSAESHSNASMANVQMYNTSLSGADIQSLYKEGIGGAPININNLVGWWPLNGNGKDYSGNGNNAEVNENVTFESHWYGGYTAP